MYAADEEDETLHLEDTTWSFSLFGLFFWCRFPSLLELLEIFSFHLDSPLRSWVTASSCSKLPPFYGAPPSFTAILLPQYRCPYKSPKMDKITTNTPVPSEEFLSRNNRRWRIWQAAMIFSIRCSAHSHIMFEEEVNDRSGGWGWWCVEVLLRCDDPCLWKSSIVAEDNVISNYFIVMIREDRHRQWDCSVWVSQWHRG